MSNESDKYGMNDLEFQMVKGELVYGETFSGDQGFAGITLEYLSNKLEKLEPLDPNDLNALLLILYRIANSKQAITIICGKPEGTPKKGHHNWQIAMMVFKKIHIEKLSKKAAYIDVAQEFSKSRHTVKNLWLELRDDIYEAVIRSNESRQSTKIED